MTGRQRLGGQREQGGHRRRGQRLGHTSDTADRTEYLGVALCPIPERDHRCAIEVCQPLGQRLGVPQTRTEYLGCLGPNTGDVTEAAKTSPRRASTTESTWPTTPTSMAARLKTARLVELHDSEPEALGQSLGRGDADPQTRKEPRTDVDGQRLDLAGRQPDLAQEVVKGGDQ